MGQELKIPTIQEIDNTLKELIDQMNQLEVIKQRIAQLQGMKSILLLQDQQAKQQKEKTNECKTEKGNI